jgi:lysophospholipase L1-like esterase
MNLQNKIINVLGDSITQGVGVSSPEHIYENVLGRLVGAREVRNYGISATRFARQIGGDDCGGAFVDRYVGMADDADLVLVFGGTNDYGHGNVPFGTWGDRTPYTFIGACHTLFEGLVKKYPASHIVVMTPLQRAGGSNPCANTGKPLSDYADAIIRVAALYSIPVLDLYRTAGICPDIPAQRELFMPDGLHPCDAGAERMAERIAAFLTAL